jgi:hypothetical protein
MQFRWSVVAVAVLCVPVLGVVAADPAFARVKQKPASRCVDRPANFSWSFFAIHPEPQPNGCAPPVYAYGKYIGQDPDRNIRFQLLRDPATGYSAHNNN